MRLLLLSLSFVFSLIIFQSGFLLKRKELHMRSKCSDAKLLHSECWMQRQYKKVVVMLVDALRYDFMVPVVEHGSRSFFRGHMPGVAKLMKNGAQIGVFLADPPTTTLQRIKALTTGTLPTFIDAGDNFAPSSNINEDNLFVQAQGRNLSLWSNQEPSQRQVEWPKCLLLHDELRSSHPADLIVAHLLGVDHCGHKYGPNHIQMSDTLRKIDEIISETLLIVMGDHGMTTTGDHGGDSDDETHAGLLVFSPGRQFPPLPKNLRQIDLVPSLSLLLGLPIPFSNLGVVIESMFPPNLSEQAIALNYEQVRRFASSYAAANPSFQITSIITHDTTVPAEQLRTIHNLQDSLRAAWTQFDQVLMRLGVFSFAETLLCTISCSSLSAAQTVVRSGCLLLQLSVIFGGSNDNPAVSLLLVRLKAALKNSRNVILNFPWTKNYSNRRP
ncbi:unnamed protein product [Heligmosomoides polygyrus]|uniref:GPI ethanolamine phosphate transferase 3 n=1 Tax=Heligmosomoides polygyrus TaxID=6339 RepID=A0A183FTT9_HELPZ|nr:unnamed protein product [Heligmosomoides polygyrus]